MTKNQCSELTSEISELNLPYRDNILISHAIVSLWASGSYDDSSIPEHLCKIINELTAKYCNIQPIDELLSFSDALLEIECSRIRQRRDHATKKVNEAIGKGELSCQLRNPTLRESGSTAVNRIKNADAANMMTEFAKNITTPAQAATAMLAQVNVLRQANDNTSIFYDKLLKCKDCGAEFVFTAGEQEFYRERGFQNEPQRCKSCRDKRKAAARVPRKFYTTVSTECVKEPKVPYKST